MSDDSLSGLCSLAVDLFNAEVNTKVGYGKDEFELLEASDDDDTDTIFHTEHFPLADVDGDGTVTVSDVLCWSDLKQDLPSSVSVASIDKTTGQITLSAARTDEVYCQYAYSPCNSEDDEFKMAYIYFVSMLAWNKLLGCVTDIRLGDYSASRKNHFEEKFRMAKEALCSSGMGIITKRKNVIDEPEYLDEDYDWGQESE
jgi:hypothetical protein